jgi:hypothetical protein
VDTEEQLLFLRTSLAHHVQAQAESIDNAVKFSSYLRSRLALARHFQQHVRTAKSVADERSAKLSEAETTAIDVNGASMSVVLAMMSTLFFSNCQNDVMMLEQTLDAVLTMIGQFPAFTMNGMQDEGTTTTRSERKSERVSLRKSLLHHSLCSTLQ